jgi:hypothetical protein
VTNKSLRKFGIVICFDPFLFVVFATEWMVHRPETCMRTSAFHTPLSSFMCASFWRGEGTVLLFEADSDKKSFFSLLACL